MLICRKCKGRILIERHLTTETYMELYCLGCGKAWYFEYPQKHKGFVKWLHKIEMDYQRRTIMGF